MAQADYLNNAICALITGTDAKTSPKSVHAAHAEFVAALAGQPPRPISVNADSIEFVDRAEHLNQVFSALCVYLSALVDDTAQNVPGRFDLRYIEAVLSDLASDVTGAIHHAASGLARRVV
jgi:hypothetical protein